MTDKTSQKIEKDEKKVKKASEAGKKVEITDEALKDVSGGLVGATGPKKYNPVGG